MIEKIGRQGRSGYKGSLLANLFARTRTTHEVIVNGEIKKSIETPVVPWMAESGVCADDVINTFADDQGVIDLLKSHGKSLLDYKNIAQVKTAISWMANEGKMEADIVKMQAENREKIKADLDNLIGDPNNPNQYDGV